MFANNKVPGFHVTSPQSNWKLETYVVLHRIEYGPQVWTNPGWQFFQPCFSLALPLPSCKPCKAMLAFCFIARKCLGSEPAEGSWMVMVLSCKGEPLLMLTQE